MIDTFLLSVTWWWWAQASFDFQSHKLIDEIVQKIRQVTDIEGYFILVIYMS